MMVQPCIAAVVLFGIHSIDLAMALIAYDCAHPSMNITTIGLDKIPVCETPAADPLPVSETIQLIQLADDYPVKVLQCKIRIDRTVTYCGYSSHASMVAGGYASYLKHITQDDCKDLHARGRYVFPNGHVKDGIMANSSTQVVVTLAGSVDNKGYCTGTAYSDNYGSWDNVIVQAFVVITLNDYTASVDTSSGNIQLRSGVSCKLTSGSCVDSESGYTFWEVTMTTQCDPRQHLVLYEGPAQVFRASQKESKVKTYMVDEGSKVFGLRTTGVYAQCMFTAYTTEHPKLVIVPGSNQHFFFRPTTLPASSLDLMTYINAKFVFVEKHHAKNIELMYKELATQRCMLERKTMMTLLSLAMISPTDFAFTYMERPGVMGVRLGEVIHVSECTPVEVKIRTTDRCYDEIPVAHNNQSMFLTPRTRLLQRHGTEIDCDPMINAQYQLDGVWYAIGQLRHMVPTPHTLTPTPVSTWEYKQVGDLAKSGIYSYEDAERLRERIMNPYERTAVNNIIVRGVLGDNLDRQGVSLSGLMDEKMVESLGAKLGKRLWGFFSIFGNVTSGLLGIFVVLKFLKFLLDTIIHGRALYEIYGFSIALIGSLWDSVTTYLLHRSLHVSNKTDHARGDSDDVHVEMEKLTQSPDVAHPKESTITPSCPDYNRRLYPNLGHP